ncbi:hypothetical protein [Paenibacillus sp.]|uniref:hypothetical protein n=1 Tax=Paenibacillus sp. TaxID=58172 RepID=UPI002D2A88B6|nr:hypothetical protein [Paenibacillus sp.]HZG87952.1 hypothetical protein [Paenibacillus sp.]
MNWTVWNLNRVIILFVGLAYLLVGIQVTLYHYRQNFRGKSMWAPVIISPLLFVSGVLLAFYRSAWSLNLFLALLVLGALIGVIGVYFHWRGVGRRVGGYELRNFMIGPPVVLPMIFAALAVFGLVGVMW